VHLGETVSGTTSASPRPTMAFDGARLQASSSHPLQAACFVRPTRVGDSTPFTGFSCNTGRDLKIWATRNGGHRPAWVIGLIYAAPLGDRSGGIRPASPVSRSCCNWVCAQGVDSLTDDVGRLLRGFNVI